MVLKVIFTKITRAIKETDLNSTFLVEATVISQVQF